MAIIHTENINRSIFRAYDIRGIVGETLTVESVFLIGKALASLLRDRNESKITVARDGRLSGPQLMTALCDGIRSAGCDVIDIGMVPTPVLYFATHLFDHHSGVMLTGSHNPSNYNGLKMVVSGQTLAEKDIQDLYHRIVEQRLYDGVGQTHPVEIEHYYLETVTNNVQLAKPLSIVIDAGNGATGDIAPKLFRALGCTVHELFCDVDGTFPNHHPDPCLPENLTALIDAVKSHEADIGIAFDGDGDRLGVVTSAGEIIAADRLMMLFAKQILSEHSDTKIIFDVKCSEQLPQLIRELGGEPLMWKTGHSHIKAKLAETKALLAGEMSGHIFFNDRWYGFDDALYSAARLLEILAMTTLSSGELFATIPNSCNSNELRIAIADEEKFDVMHSLSQNVSTSLMPKEVNTIDGLRVMFEHGWGLIRPSNTTPCLILRFEALNELFLTEIKERFRHWILETKPDLELPF